jgi:hypothetical protein
VSRAAQRHAAIDAPRWWFGSTTVGLIHQIKAALLTDPWVFGSAGEGGAVAAEGEHGEGDEGFWGAESERDSG